MASLSLPRVLQLKKNSVDAEREHFEKFQTLAIQKAINSVETPVKEKHVRSTIIGTYQEQSAITYWMVAVRLPLQDNRIVAWKFCHVTHKLLREGHPACLDDSQRHVGMIENLGKLWVHLREGYGKLVAVYCRLLAVKLQFHARNPRFPGNMSLSSEELDAIAENDVNNYFQICVELFDYMDEILNLQSAVFDSVGNARANSMTASGQCRLAALIPCAQDSSHIYDCNVRLLFRLHAALPADTLAGHRDRFRGQFKKLSQFYKHASSLQYYRNLLSLPVLPADPPNFLLQSDFGTYVTPVVSIPEPADEPDAVGALIDTSDTISQVTSQDLDAFDTRTTPSPQPDPVLERDRLIDHLQNELKRMRSEVHQMVQERNSLMSSMKEHCTRLETQLQVAKLEIDEERQKAELISAETPEIKQKLSAVEEKARLTDEKFQKLKGAYTQLREEHIALIRQKAEVDKRSAGLRAAAAQHESAKMALQQQLNDKIKDVELLQQSASSSEEVEAYKNELAALRTDLEKSRQKELELESLKASFEALDIEHKTTATESHEKLNLVKTELEEVRTNLESIKQEKEERDSELSRVKEELVALRNKSGEEFNKAVKENEAAIQEIATLKEQFVQEKQEHVSRANDLQEELDKMSLKLTDLEVHVNKESEKWMSLITEKNQLSDSLLDEKDKEINKALNKAAELQKICDDYKTKYETRIKSHQNEIDVLNDKINTFMENIKERDKDYADEKQSLLDKIKNLSNEKELLQKEVADNEIKIENLNQNITELTDKYDKQIKDFQESQHQSTENITELEEIINRYRNNIIVLETKVTESHAVENNLNKNIEKFAAKVHELETAIEDKDSVIELLNLEVDKVNKSAETKITEFEAQKTELENQILTLNKSINEMMSAKNETVRYLEENVSSFETNNKNLQTELEKLEDQLIEREAELEICKNELLTLKDEHEVILKSNDDNIAMKNKELRMLNEEIIKITKEKVELVKEMKNLSLNLGTEKQVLETKVKNLENERDELKIEFKKTQSRKQEMIDNLNEEVKKLSSFYDQMREAKEHEIQILNAKIDERTISFNNQAYERDNLIRQATNSIEELKVQLNDSKRIKDNEIRELESVISEKESQNQMLEGRLVHVEKEKLTAECELQDLLQHNTALEESNTVLKKQLDEAQRLVETSRGCILSAAGGAAAEVSAAALAALQRSPPDWGQAGARGAAQAFRDLAHNTQVKGSEESLGRSAVLAAHNAAQLSAYVTEVASIATDAALTEKLQSECRTMLTSTLQCMESLKNGVIDPCAYQLSEKVSAIGSAANMAAVTHGDVTSVDAQLADMDSAIEDAAKQIEELLKTSRAADTGIKLEVNSTILSACTTLMAAVRELVQHSRSLQNALGDVTTRLKLYRKNPQWSDGLISAAKAVVFAAKLLVSSADEAVSGSGRLEGVSAAAHEVGGATAQLVSASRARAPAAAPALHALTAASRAVAAATGALVAAARQAAARALHHEALDTSSLSLTATRILEMESRVRALELEAALEAERARLAALRKRHYQLEQADENGGITNGNDK